MAGVSSNSKIKTLSFFADESGIFVNKHLLANAMHCKLCTGVCCVTGHQGRHGREVWWLFLPTHPPSYPSLPPFPLPSPYLPPTLPASLLSFLSKRSLQVGLMLDLGDAEMD